MTTSIAIILCLGLLANYIFTKLKLPGLLGMLLLGIVLGPSGLNWLDQSLLNFSADFRSLALIIILLRAGLGISRQDLSKAGSSALKMSFVPCIFEGLTAMLAAHYLLKLPIYEAAMLGFILAAVSPAVVLPAMIGLTEKGYGKAKAIPTIVLAGASVDGVVAITLFNAVVGMYLAGNSSFFMQLLGIPLAILLGGLLGAAMGLGLVWLFKTFHMRDTKKVLLMLGAAIFIMSIEKYVKQRLNIAGLIGVMTIGFVLLERSPIQARRISVKLSKVWVFAELLLFVLVGAAFNIHAATSAGFLGVLIIIIGLLGRSLGVFAALLGTNLNFREKGFCAASYLPKATVQAAIGAIPLSMGLASGELILAIAVMSIIITAPIGAIAIEKLGPISLEQ